MDRLGRYEIISELGRGAMGIVYRAHDPRIGRDVAIKTIKLADQAEPDETQALRDRLFREAQSAGRLSHPGIVTIYDIAEESGVAYITMEFVEGRTLESMMNAGEVKDLVTVDRLIEQMSSALDYAHAREIVHRDIKPANILVTPEGDIKITDFGIARIASSKMTQTGTVMGTPSYMSPEQVRGETIDGRSDQFSLTVIAYELVTGRKPFTGDSLTAVIFKIVSEQPTRPREINSELPEAVDDVIVKGLAKTADERFDSCKALSERLSACLTGVEKQPAVNATPLRTSRQPPPPTMMAELQETASVEPEAEVSTADQETVFSGPSIDAEEEAEKSTESVGQQTLPPLATKTAGVEALEVDASGPKKKKRARAWVEYAFAAVIGVAITLVALNPSVVRKTMDLLGLFQTEDGLDGLAPPKEAFDTSSPRTPPVTSRAPDVTPPAGVPPAERTASETGVSKTTPPPDIVSTAPPPVKPVAPVPAPPVLASVSFSTEPRGTKIVVDGKPEWTCTAPCELELPAGDHTAVASMAGHYPARKSFSSARDTMSVSLKPDAIVGTVMVSSTPSGADIFVDGQKQARKTNAILKLKPGTHVVRVQGPGLSSERSVEVLANETASLQFAAGTQ